MMITKTKTGKHENRILGPIRL